MWAHTAPSLGGSSPLASSVSSSPQTPAPGLSLLAPRSLVPMSPSPVTLPSWTLKVLTPTRSSLQGSPRDPRRPSCPSPPTSQVLGLLASTLQALGLLAWGSGKGGPGRRAPPPTGPAQRGRDKGHQRALPDSQEGLQLGWTLQGWMAVAVAAAMAGRTDPTPGGHSGRNLGLRGTNTRRWEKIIWDLAWPL